LFQVVFLKQSLNHLQVECIKVQKNAEKCGKVQKSLHRTFFNMPLNQKVTL